MVKTYISHFFNSIYEKQIHYIFFCNTNNNRFYALYMIEIPSPSTIITEKYTLNLK